MKFLFGIFALFIGCQNDSGDSPSEASSQLSTHFETAGCTSSSCHGTDGKRESAALHDPEGNPITNLSKSERDFDSWRDWIRNTAKSPMPRYAEETYPEASLESDYRILTGREI